MQEMQEIIQSINIGEKDFSLYMDVVDDEGNYLVKDRKADSLTSNLLAVLYSFFSGENIPNRTVVRAILADIDNDIIPITAISTAGDPVQITATNHTLNTGEYVQLMGVDGNTALNAEWIVTKLDNDNYTLDGSTHTGTESLASNPMMREMRDLLLGSGFRADAESLGYMHMRVGRNNTATIITQNVLNDEIPEGVAIQNRIQHNPTTESVIGVAGQVAEITITTDFTNRIKTTTTSAGGRVLQLLHILKRQFSQPDALVIKEIDGSTPNRSQGTGNLFCAAPGGFTKVHTGGTGYSSENVGPVVGSGTSIVDISDFQLETKIPHRDFIGPPFDELRHYGVLVDNFDESSSPATFDIIRIFENKSGQTITINESALYSSLLISCRSSQLK